MKTNKFIPNRINIRLALAALSFFPFISIAQIYVPISDKVGIGTTAPASKLDVEGGISIGSTYSGTTAAPSNGAIIEGNVGIGTSSPSEFLEVAGNVKVGSSNAYMINTDKILWNNGRPENIFAGAGAGNSTTGLYNSFVGYHAGYVNTSSGLNAAFGFAALASNTNGYGRNSAFGYASLYSNSTGYYNVGVGSYAMYANTTGLSNTACGYYSLHTNTSGANNTAIGSNALGDNTIGYNNTSIGVNAGYIRASDTACTFVGFGTLANNNFSNAGAFGNGATTTASGKYYFGNSTIVGLYTVSGWFANSDGRFKTNVTENVKGLGFIKKLRPVTYNLNTQALDDFIIQDMPDSVKTLHKQGMDFVPSMTKVHSGFIAQEVEQAAQQVGFTSSIVSAPANSTDPYALNYAEIVVPLVKAVQELSASADSTNTSLAQKDSINSGALEAMQNKIDQLEAMINSCCTLNETRVNPSPSNTPSQTSINQTKVELNDSQTIVLEQNVPNPFAEQTTINYSLPDNTLKAQMLFYNAQGKLIQSTELTQKGKGILNVFASDLSSGIYTYTLVVDGVIIESKKMVKQ